MARWKDIWGGFDPSENSFTEEDLPEAESAAHSKKFFTFFCVLAFCIVLSYELGGIIGLWKP